MPAVGGKWQRMHSHRTVNGHSGCWVGGLIMEYNTNLGSYQLAQGIGGGMDAGQGGNHPQDARQCSLRMLNGEVRLLPSAIRRQTPTYIQC